MSPRHTFFHCVCLSCRVASLHVFSRRLFSDYLSAFCPRAAAWPAERGGPRVHFVAEARPDDSLPDAVAVDSSLAAVAPGDWMVERSAGVRCAQEPDPMADFDCAPAAELDDYSGPAESAADERLAQDDFPGPDDSPAQSDFPGPDAR